MARMIIIDYDVMVESLEYARLSGYGWTDEPVTGALMLRLLVCHSTVTGTCFDG